MSFGLHLNIGISNGREKKTRPNQATDYRMTRTCYLRIAPTAAKGNAMLAGVV